MDILVLYGCGVYGWSKSVGGTGSGIWVVDRGGGVICGIDGYI